MLKETLFQMGKGMRGRGWSLRRWEGERSCPRPAPPLPLRRGPLAPVPRVWRQQQWEALWHLRLQRLQRLLQEKRETEAHLQVREGRPPAWESPASLLQRDGGFREDTVTANVSKAHGSGPRQDIDTWGFPPPAGAKWGQGCALWTKPTGTSARPAD